MERKEQQCVFVRDIFEHSPLVVKYRTSSVVPLGVTVVFVVFQVFFSHKMCRRSFPVWSLHDVLHAFRLRVGVKPVTC